MKTLKVVSIALLLVIALTLFPGIAVAQDEPTPTPTATPGPDTITLSTAYPTIEAQANNMFQFNVELKYTGATNRVFDLAVTPPQGWSTQITPLYETTKVISSITMEASETGRSQSIQVSTGSFYTRPEPGDYTITVKATSGELTGAIDLTARVTARYSLYAEPAEGRYSLAAKSGKDNYFSIEVENDGTAPIENVTFTSDKTQGWEITFGTDKIDILEPGAKQSVDVNIKPAAKTVSGDYEVRIWVNGKQASFTDIIKMRVTVETASVWGWVGIVIILLVVAGLVLIFIRFGRR